MRYTICRLKGCEKMEEMEAITVSEQEKELILLYRSIPDDKKEKFYTLLLSLKKLILE